ncbi:MAG: hypothetical protein V4556_14090 [Bacteroidota bacterium]
MPQTPSTLKVIFVAALICLFSTAIYAQTNRFGLGTTNPKTYLHIVDGLSGNMGFPYEAAVIEKTEDSKLGIYSTSTYPVDYKTSAVALGFSNYLDQNNQYSGFEMQYGIWSNSGYILRFNALSRNTAGNYVAATSYSNILVMDRQGRVGINLTTGQPVAPQKPSANLHVNGTVRFQNLPEASTGGNYLVVDDSGNIKISSGTIANRPVVNTETVTAAEEIVLLKEQIRILNERILALEQKTSKRK